MHKKFFKSTIAWGLLLWAIGYLLGIVLFTFVPANLLGWIISPIGIVITLYVLIVRMKMVSWSQCWSIGGIWTAIAIVFDYFFLVLAFHPADGYYKFDVYMYYALTFVLPLLVGVYKLSKKS